MKMRRKKGSNELFSLVDGKKVDAALHDEILNNPDADRALAEQAIERALARGMTRKQAEDLYGV